MCKNNTYRWRVPGWAREIAACLALFKARVEMELSLRQRQSAGAVDRLEPCIRGFTAFRLQKPNTINEASPKYGSSITRTYIRELAHRESRLPPTPPAQAKDSAPPSHLRDGTVALPVASHEELASRHARRARGEASRRLRGGLGRC